MLKGDFRNNLINSINELDIDYNEYIKFRVIPISESGKKLNSTDDWMRLGILNQKNLGDNCFGFEEVVNMLSGPNSRFPLWITIELVEENDIGCFIELKTSLRFRTPSVLQNQETGHPPFKVIKKEHNK